MTPYLATAAHSYGEGDTREERRETQHHVLEAVVAVGFVEGSEHAIEVGLGVLNEVVVVLHNERPVHGVRNGLVLLRSSNRRDPVVARRLALKAQCVVLVEVVCRFNQQAELYRINDST